MSDMISKQQVINTIQNAFELATNNVGEKSIVYGICESITGICKAMIMQLPSAEPQERKTGRWIPCSERLPEEDVEVLVTQKNGFVRHALLTDFYGYGNKFVTYEEGMTVCDVIAWMPLPEPYKEET